MIELASQIFRDLWDAKAAQAREQVVQLRKEIAETGRKVDKLLERIVDATSASVVAAYECKIKDLEIHKAMLSDKATRTGKPVRGFSETYRTAFEFLSNPQKLWRSPRAEDRRAVLKLVFSQKLAYQRGHGYRTAQVSAPFELLGDFMMKKEMVPRAGIEPATRGFSIRCSTN